MTHSFTEENYLKIIYHLSQRSAGTVQTNTIADEIQTKPASVTDMLKKLSDKKLVNYVKYQGVTLTAKGVEIAVNIVRKHRLWEVFLVDKLNFKWDEVHEIAEELEHINSPVLVERLDKFLGFPKKDPHGDPIPDRHGIFETLQFTKMSKLQTGDKGIVVGVSEHSSAYLKHLEKLGLTLGKHIEILEVADFDGSVELNVSNEKLNISREVARHILIKK
ncbi:metal-dependent transcriptional regulator [Pedobacter duraquae]|uniref:Transcriptional regulator MntR n=1 Tax=Pedobacter duraquae TaxID=425511 RepID=A0A4R6IQV3_9SPHI|nr:metal-dependent transcriptional regulator [Pedobacter duraquae]TDO24396.1 DtxR family iron (metal) dependent repressor [Pedobacter duraquae]